MNIIGVGVDIEEIERFRKKPYEKNARFFERLFTQKEIDYCLSKRFPYQHFAARFCAKEALAKALPETMIPGWAETEVIHEDDLRPVFHFCAENPQKQLFLSTLKIQLSLSHDQTHAIAFVIVLSRKEI